jgi:hypothetical protein
LLIDVASEVYGLRVGEHFTLALSSTLRLDGQPDSEHYEPSTKASTQCRLASELNTY